MNVMNKMDDSLGNINPRYNITTAKCCELIGNAADLADAVGIGFQKCSLFD